MIKLFLWNFRDFVGFIIIFFPQISDLIFVCQAWPVDWYGRPHQRSQSTVPVDWRARIRARRLTLHPVDRSGRPTESCLLSGIFGRPRRSTGSHNGSKFDRWAVDRPGRPEGYFWQKFCKRLFSVIAYKYPIWERFSLRFSVRIFADSLVFSKQSKEVFELELYNPFGVFIRVWKIKERVFGKEFWLNYSILISWFFPRIFFVISDFHSFGFLHTWAKIYYLYL